MSVAPPCVSMHASCGTVVVAVSFVQHETPLCCVSVTIWLTNLTELLLDLAARPTQFGSAQHKACAASTLMRALPSELKDTHVWFKTGSRLPRAALPSMSTVLHNTAWLYGKHKPVGIDMKVPTAGVVVVVVLRRGVVVVVVVVARTLLKHRIPVCAWNVRTWLTNLTERLLDQYVSPAQFGSAQQRTFPVSRLMLAVPPASKDTQVSFNTGSRLPRMALPNGLSVLHNAAKPVARQ